MQRSLFLYAVLSHPVMLRDTIGGGCVRFDFVAVTVAVYLPLRPSDTSPIFCCAKHPVMLRGTAEEEGEMYFSFASAPILYVTPCNVTGYGGGRCFEALFYYVILSVG